MKTNLTADTYVMGEKLWLFFGLFSGDKGDYSDMCMIKITIKIDMDVCFFQKNITYKNHASALSPAFSHDL